MENRKLAGIYKILNTKNKKFYIGSAKSLYYRKATHFTNLSKNKHHNKPLQNSYNKYGKGCFVFSVIEYCEIEHLIEKEQYYIDTFKPHYNLCKIAGSPLGLKRSEETKLKLSKNHKRHNLGKIFSDEIRKNMSIGQRKRKPPSEKTKEKTRQSLIGKVFSKERKNNISKSLRGKKLSKNSLDKRILKQYKSVLQYDLNMTLLFEYKSLQDASKETGISYSFLGQLVRGVKASKKYKFIFKYKKDAI